MNQHVTPLRSKHWTSDHVRLASTATDARERVRRLIPRVPDEFRSELSQIANALTWALKARRVPERLEATHEAADTSLV